MMKFLKGVPLPEIAGTKEGKLIIIGCSRCVWDDIEKLMPIECDVMCINDMISYYPGVITHAYTNNEGRLESYWASRRKFYKKTFGEPLFHTLSRWNTEHISWPLPGIGTSSYNACRAALAMGYDEIILCGCPMDNSGHFWEAPWGPDTPELNPRKKLDFYSQFISGIGLWESLQNGGKVTSMSGNTKKYLG
jgi:hypothetical protein